jgi:heme iron utilization protein
VPLKEKFGEVMEHLETMTDFHLVRLMPGRGRLVTGFGQAYDVDPLDWTQVTPVGGGGHRQSAEKKG